MGSNVFNFPGARNFISGADTYQAPNPGAIQNPHATEAVDAQEKGIQLSALGIPSFKRRPPAARGELPSKGESWAVAAKRRAALRLVDPTVERPRSMAPSSGAAAPAPVVRVMQLVEAGQLPGTTGRIRLSGRLSDVCAELERMAAAESRSSGRALRA